MAIVVSRIWAFRISTFGILGFQDCNYGCVCKGWDRIDFPGFQHLALSVFKAVTYDWHHLDIFSQKKQNLYPQFFFRKPEKGASLNSSLSAINVVCKLLQVGSYTKRDAFLLAQ
jgi:hypothetical protein